MPAAVRYDQYGQADVLRVVEVDLPSPAPGQVVVAVVSAGINPGEVPVREGFADALWPATFPSGQGSDFAGRISAVGAGVERHAVGDEVLGFTNDRAAQAEYVAVAADQVTPKPSELDWNRAGSLFVAGSTAYACVRAVGPGPGDTVAVSSAAGADGLARGELVLDIAAVYPMEAVRAA